MCSDRNVDRAIGYSRFCIRGFLRPNDAGELSDNNRKAVEPGFEGFKMLVHQKSRRRDQRGLKTGHCSEKRGAHCDFSFPESSVAADQPIHRCAGTQIFHHIGHCRVLVVRFIVEETCKEVLPRLIVLDYRGSRPDLALSCDSHELVGNFENILL